jgi:predicted nucleotidyltransferase
MENIRKLLQEIEEKHHITILYACETGSRAWGFPSPDSDYDIRFIYMHPKDWYLSLQERKDTIELKITDDLDVTGWDLKKSLILLKKSNAPLIERFQSPIEYYAAPYFKTAFCKLINAYYNPIAVFHHHYSLALKFWEDLKDKHEVKLKGYFYLIRSLLSCNWIVEDELVLPMDIEGLMTKIEPEYRDKLRELIRLKETVGEKYMYAVETDLHSWIINLWGKIEMSKDKLTAKSMDYSLLDEFFLTTLNGEANH